MKELNGTLNKLRSEYFRNKEFQFKESISIHNIDFTRNKLGDNSKVHETPDDAIRINKEVPHQIKVFQNFVEKNNDQPINRKKEINYDSCLKEILKIQNAFRKWRDHKKLNIQNNCTFKRTREGKDHNYILKKELDSKESKNIRNIDSSKKLRSVKTSRNKFRNFSKHNQEKIILSGNRRFTQSSGDLFTKTMTRQEIKQMADKIVSKYMIGRNFKVKEKERVKIPFLTRNLFRACIVSDITWIRENMNYLNLRKLHFLDQNGNTPLYICVSKNNYKIAHYLIETGAKI